MSDVVDPDTRSRMMAGISSKDTNPEMIVRKGLFKRGFRYRLHMSGIPGTPDLVLKKYSALILVNGCFWHGHDCHLFKWPKTRPDFWKRKIRGNMERDRRNIQLYGELGWRVLIVWECTLKGKHRRDQCEVIECISQWIIGENGYMEITGEENPHR